MYKTINIVENKIISIIFRLFFIFFLIFNTIISLNSAQSVIGRVVNTALEPVAEANLTLYASDYNYSTISNNDRSFVFYNITSVSNDNLPIGYAISENYPNPFNPSTTIEYNIPEAGNVEVKVYDINGRLVKELEKDFRNPGQYKIQWDSRNNLGHKVARGIYMLQVRYNKTALTKK